MKTNMPLLLQSGLLDTLMVRLLKQVDINHGKQNILTLLNKMFEITGEHYSNYQLRCERIFVNELIETFDIVNLTYQKEGDISIYLGILSKYLLATKNSFSRDKKG